VTPPGFVADVASMDGSVNLLVEITAVLHEGRLDRDRGTLARAPHSHHEVGEKDAGCSRSGRPRVVGGPATRELIAARLSAAAVTTAKRRDTGDVGSPLRLRRSSSYGQTFR